MTKSRKSHLWQWITKELGFVYSYILEISHTMSVNQNNLDEEVLCFTLKLQILLIEISPCFWSAYLSIKVLSSLYAAEHYTWRRVTENRGSNRKCQNCGQGSKICQISQNGTSGKSVLLSFFGYSIILGGTSHTAVSECYVSEDIYCNSNP